MKVLSVCKGETTPSVFSNNDLVKSDHAKEFFSSSSAQSFLILPLMTHSTAQFQLSLSPVQPLHLTKGSIISRCTGSGGLNQGILETVLCVTRSIIKNTALD